MQVGMKASGFSLIELMVVIAIVALLAAVAIPSYKNYMIGARFSSVVTVVTNLINKSIMFSNINGRFANAYDLGYEAASPGNNYASWVDSPAAFGLAFGGNAPSNFPNGIILGEGIYYYFANQTCGQYGSLAASLNPVYLELPASTTPWVQCFYWHNSNSIITTACYYATDATSPMAGNIVPGWTNMYPNGAAATVNVNALTGFSTATCQ